jgi:hypothetical protein
MKDSYKVKLSDMFPIYGLNQYLNRNPESNASNPAAPRAYALAAYNMTLISMTFFNQEILSGLEKIVDKIK